MTNPIGLDVSRETLDDLKSYVSILRKWNSSINLVSKSTISDIWNRHIWDSAQLVVIVGKETPKCWIDLGSGGGLPGLVISILLKGSPTKVTMIESDSRKCAFLRTVIRELKLNSDVIEGRVERLDPLNADIISARAFADLETLMGLTELHRKKDGICLFLKGQSHEVELTEARENWNMEVEVEPSLTSQRSCVLKIKEFSRVR